MTYLLAEMSLCAVGNKDDNDRKVVQPSDARRLADQVGIPFCETSAKENKNVEEVGVMKYVCEPCYHFDSLHDMVTSVAELIHRVSHYQAHREPQRGPGNHSRGALSQFPYVLRARHREGGNVGRGVPSPSD